MNAGLKILKKSGDKEDFNQQKLEYSLICAGASKEQAAAIANQVYTRCSEGTSTRKIFNHAFSLLKKENKIIATHYSMTKAIEELGPDGYHFEKFIAAMFGVQSYEVTTNQMISGQCVDHELDVIAKKSGKNIYCECKFHNKPATKNDLKTALYVHARHLDLKASPDCDVTEFWLISNTKFTKDAIEYANCVGLHLMGPNHPKHNALADMARKTHIHPVTALTSLKKSQARQLLKQGIILAHELIKFPDRFNKVALSEEQRHAVLSEVRALQRYKNGY